MQQYFTALLIIVAKLSILDICEAPGYTNENDATWIKCNRKILKHVKSATGEECKTKTMQSVKVQHEILQYIKSVQHEKKCIAKSLLHKKVPHGNGAVWKSATWKDCSMEKQQQEKI